MSVAAVKIKCIVINSANPSRAVEFWSQLLGRSVTAEYPPYIELRKDGEINVVIQHVSDLAGGGAVHFDLKVSDLNATIQRVCDLGGKHIETMTKDKWSWAIMRDPDGNTFCLCD